MVWGGKGGMFIVRKQSKKGRQVEKQQPSVWVAVLRCGRVEDEKFLFSKV